MQNGTPHNLHNSPAGRPFAGPVGIGRCDEKRPGLTARATAKMYHPWVVGGVVERRVRCTAFEKIGRIGKLCKKVVEVFVAAGYSRGYEACYSAGLQEARSVVCGSASCFRI